MKMLLEIKNLVSGYGNFQALREVSLNIKQGEIVTLLGANGSGKTTLVKTIASLVKASKGEIIFNGERIDQLPSYEVFKKGISICPEGGGCFPDMSVLKNLIMGTLLIKDRSIIEKGYEQAIELFPILGERKMQKAGSLSGGERQMLAIGRALMCRPKLLLLDEPSLGLAPLIIKSIFEAIGKLRERGLTILLIEQNASKSLTVADRGYVMELGRILISGASKVLIEDPQVKKAYLGM
jgi:branched-chain amino acid transport system ATP-binding protein